MKKVYLAGKFRGKTKWDVAWNIRRMEVAGLEVAKLGAVPVIPHSMFGNFDGELTDEYWLEATKDLMLVCDGLYIPYAADLVSSQGTQGELEEARRINMKVFVGDIKKSTAWFLLESWVK